MYNNQAISSLSREELVKALQKFQLKSGPITRTTRRIFENRLKTHLESNSSQNDREENTEKSSLVDDELHKECNVYRNDRNNEITTEPGVHFDHQNNVSDLGIVIGHDKCPVEVGYSDNRKAFACEDEDFTCNTVLNYDHQTSRIVLKQDGKGLSDIQTHEVNVSSNIANGDSKASLDRDTEKISTGDQNNEINVTQTLSETQQASPSTNICETLMEHDACKNTSGNMSICTSNQDPKTPYFYAVWIPYSSTRLNGNIPIIFESQQEALAKMKSFKGSRFKVFESKEEAEQFSLSKSINSCELELPFHSVKPQKTEPMEKEKILKAPTFQEIVKFRQHIEKFKIEEVEACLTNPRYLINGNDIPVILQEGSRMNAVHIGIKCNCFRLLKGIFKKIQSDEYLCLVYPNASDAHLQFRKNHLLDLYLNTPEKILCDTPLHMACKLGLTNIIRFLLSFKQIKEDAKNIDGQTCVEVICDRISNRPVAEREKIKAEIISVFTEKTYVPLYGDKDGLQSKIGFPITTLSPNNILSKTANVKAYAGPMNPEQANIVFGKWKKSPRDCVYSVIACSDYEKGMERIGRSIASSEKVPFNEYWPFLDKYINLASTKGLKKLEKYLKSKYKDSNQNCELVNSASITTTKKYRQRTEVLYNNDKTPVDLKRKLTFEEETVSLKNEECKTNDELISSTQQNQNESEKELNSQKDNGQLRINDKNVPLHNENVRIKSQNILDSKENQLSIQNKYVLVLDEKVPSKTKITHSIVENDVVDLKVDYTAPELNKDAEDTYNIAPEITRTYTNQNISKFTENKLISNRCSPVCCLCDINISEECYLSESFNHLSLDRPIEEAGSLTLVDEDNAIVDVANQCQSNHRYTSGIYSSFSTNTLNKNDNRSESGETDSYKNSNDENQDKDYGKEDLPDLFTVSPSSPLIDSSFKSPINSSPTFNSPHSCISSFRHKDKSNDLPHLNGHSEQHVFIDGDQPSKHDLDVLRAISESAEICNFPHIRRWMCLVESFSDDAKSSWPSPGSPRYKKTLSKRSGWTL